VIVSRVQPKQITTTITQLCQLMFHLMESHYKMLKLHKDPATLCVFCFAARLLPLTG
jgi:hypothetical protein